MSDDYEYDEYEMDMKRHWWWDIWDYMRETLTVTILMQGISILFLYLRSIQVCVFLFVRCVLFVSTRGFCGVSYRILYNKAMSLTGQKPELEWVLFRRRWRLLSSIQIHGVLFKSNHGYFTVTFMVTLGWLFRDITKSIP